ncbi:DUF4397 domain-containing protein [Fictibacillus nanhaiensis]|uniref:DUF4397 domain-containing protein n=1 Tax=Fictibacillus nanhaiensis TaxID=742169 RepID=UPI001C94E48F|nr:DUF4397 domain-containing protein [Fictibacillus nanhaiensis]MBY6037571.1 DUF4397 domain-containing protein [Fictibacillus nanhaiensis]
MKKIVGSALAAVMMFALMATGVFAESNDAMVRIVHASPDAQAVDVYVDGNAVVEGAEFKAATDYMPVPAGEHKVEIFAAGTKDNAVISQTVTVEAGKAYTAAAANTLEMIELVVAEDSMQATEGKTKVRIGHLSPDAPTVDIGLIGGDALFSGATFKAFTDYKELDPNTYDLEIRTPDGTQVLDLSGTKLEANMVYSVYAINTADKLEVLVLQDSMVMPSEMPKTGMGGASESTTDYTTGIIASVVGLGVLAFAAYRKRTAH